MNTFVLLVNPDLNANTPVSFVIGASGRKYGKSTFQRQLARLGIKGLNYGHVAKLTVAEYEAGAADIMAASHRRGNKWLAKFVTEIPPEAQEFIAGMSLASEGRDLPDEASPSAKAGWEVAVSSGSPPLTEEDFPNGVPSAPSPLVDPTDQPPTPESAAQIHHTSVEAAQECGCEPCCAFLVRDSAERARAWTSGATAQPPTDNAHVETGCEQFVEHGNVPHGTHVPQVHEKMNWLKLKKIAKDEGADISQAKGNPALVAAILANRTKQPAGV